MAAIQGYGQRNIKETGEMGGQVEGILFYGTECFPFSAAYDILWKIQKRKGRFL